MARVASIGPNVKNVQVGDLVFSPMGLGSWRTHAIAPAAALLKAPSDIPIEYAASLLVNPMTALLLLQQVELKAGDVIVQNGANSTVGQSIIQIAKSKGIKTVNIIRNRYEIRFFLAAPSNQCILAVQ